MTQCLRSSRSPRRLLLITPTSTITLAASIAGRDAGANRLQASNAPGPSILATASSLSKRPTITFFCATGPPLRPVSIAPWRSSRISCLPGLALLTLKCFAMVTVSRWDLAMLERDYATAEKILADSRSENFSPAGDALKTYYQGRLALAHGDTESAQRYFAAATPDAEKRVRDNPDAADRHAVLGLLYAYLQRKDDAVRESRQAVELEPE